MEKNISKILNLSTSKSIEINLEICNTPSSRTRGLMFRKKCIPLLFTFDKEGIYPIHSFFVSFLFDAIYLDENFIITDIFRQIKPFTKYVANTKPAKYLLELPCDFPLQMKIDERIKIDLPAKNSTLQNKKNQSGLFP